MSAIKNRETGARLQIDFDGDDAVVTMRDGRGEVLLCEFAGFEFEQLMRSLLRERWKHLPGQEYMVGALLTLVDTEDGVELVLPVADAVIARVRLDKKQQADLAAMLSNTTQS